MDLLELVALTPLMELTSGVPDVVLGMVDGPVHLEHPDLAGVRALAGTSGRCRDTTSAACLHGTFVASVLCGRRDGRAPGIAPGCTLFLHPLFGDAVPGGAPPEAAPAELAAALVACAAAGAHVVNVSAALTGGPVRQEAVLEDAVRSVAERDVLVVVAAGNGGNLSGSPLARNPWVVPVAACGHDGFPAPGTNLGRAVAVGGLRAPGEGVVGACASGGSVVAGGTSVAASFVSGAAALLRSRFPGASAAEVKRALLVSARGGRRSVVPPLMDAWSAHRLLAGAAAGRAVG